MAMERYDLPEGWEWRTIRSVVMPKETWSKSKTPRKTFQYVDISSVDNKVGIIGEAKAILGDNPPSRAKRVIREGDVIFATTRPYLKNIAVVPERLDNQICSTGFCVLRSNLDQVTTEWLFYICRSNIVVDQVVPNQEKSAYPAVSDDEIYDSEIPVPPLLEQRRIVKRIEELTRRVEESRKLRTANLEDISRFLPSAMETCFQGDDDWIEKPLNELCVMKTGKTPPTSHPEYFNGDIPFVCPADVGERLLISDAQRRLSIKAIEDRKATVFEKGTVLLVCIGSTIGKVGLSARRLCTNQQITGLVFNDGVLPEFAAWFLTQQRETVRNAAAGGGVPIINQNGVGQLSMRFPEDKAEQHRIVEYLNGLQSKAEELKQLQTETETELEAFTPALLSKAFRGEL